jgi:hypothetical protein
MVRITRGPAADQTWLLGHESNVLPVANSPRLGKGKDSFVDAGN